LTPDRTDETLDAATRRAVPARSVSGNVGMVLPAGLADVTPAGTAARID
jgi:hypothetical protein